MVVLHAMVASLYCMQWYSVVVLLTRERERGRGRPGGGGEGGKVGWGELDSE